MRLFYHSELFVFLIRFSSFLCEGLLVYASHSPHPEGQKPMSHIIDKGAFLKSTMFITRWGVLPPEYYAFWLYHRNLGRISNYLVETASSREGVKRNMCMGLT